MSDQREGHTVIELASFSSALARLLPDLAARLEARRFRLAVAESCTGGMIAAACTSLAGSSAWFEAGFVTYSIPAKIRLLGVPTELIERSGVVSRAVAQAMAVGVLDRCDADVAVAVTGIAGPGGATEKNPAGTVWVGWAHLHSEHVTSECFLFRGDRESVRQQAVEAALAGLLELPCLL